MSRFAVNSAFDDELEQLGRELLSQVGSGPAPGGITPLPAERPGTPRERLPSVIDAAEIKRVTGRSASAQQEDDPELEALGRELLGQVVGGDGVQGTARRPPTASLRSRIDQAEEYGVSPSVLVSTEGTHRRLRMDVTDEEVTGGLSRIPERPSERGTLREPGRINRTARLSMERKLIDAQGGDVSGLSDDELERRLQQRGGTGSAIEPARASPFSESFNSEFKRAIEPFTPFLSNETRESVRMRSEGGGAGWFLGSVAGSIIPSAVGVASGGIGMVPIVAAYAGKEAGDAYERTGNIANAIGHGVFEGGSEFLGGRALRKLSEKAITKLGEAILQRNWKGAAELIRPVFAGGNVEGLEEVASSVGGILTDALTGEEGDLSDGATWGRVSGRIVREGLTAYAGGFIAGGAIETPAALAGAAARRLSVDGAGPAAQDGVVGIDAAGAAVDGEGQEPPQGSAAGVSPAPGAADLSGDVEPAAARVGAAGGVGGVVNQGAVPSEIASAVGAPGPAAVPGAAPGASIDQTIDPTVEAEATAAGPAAPEGSPAEGERPASPDLTADVAAELQRRGVPAEQVQELSAAIVERAGGDAETARFIVERVTSVGDGLLQRVSGDSQRDSDPQTPRPSVESRQPLSSTGGQSGGGTGQDQSGRRAGRSSAFPSLKSSEPELTVTFQRVTPSGVEAPAASSGEEATAFPETKSIPQSASPSGSFRPGASSSLTRSSAPAAASPSALGVDDAAQTQGQEQPSPKSTRRSVRRADSASPSPQEPANAQQEEAQGRQGLLKQPKPTRKKSATRGVEPEGSTPPPAPAAPFASSAPRENGAGEPGGLAGRAPLGEVFVSAPFGDESSYKETDPSSWPEPMLQSIQRDMNDARRRVHLLTTEVINGKEYRTGPRNSEESRKLQEAFDDVRRATGRMDLATKGKLDFSVETAAPPANAETEKPAKERPKKRASKAAAGERENGGSSSALASPPRSLGAPPRTELKQRDRIQVEPVAGGTPKTIRQIELDLQMETGRVRAGKPGGQNYGTYYPGSSKTIVRFSGDLDTTAHEIAHRLDDLYGVVADWATPRGYDKLGRPLPKKSPFDDELRADIFQTTSRPRYKVVMKRAEGVAEYFRAWMVNPAAAEAAAPKFTAFVRTKVPKEALDRIRRFGDDIRKWAGMSEADRVAANIEMSLDGKNAVKALREAVKGNQPGEFQITFLDRLNAATLDSLSPLWKAVAFAKKLRGVGDLLPSKDPKTLVRTFAGFDAKFSDVLENGMVDSNNERIAGIGGVSWLLEPLNTSSRDTLERDMRSTVAFMVSERVVERAQAIDDARDKAAQIMDEIKAKIAEIEREGAATINGSTGKTLGEELIDLKRDLTRTMKSVGYTGPYRGFGQWGESKKQRMAGIGAGIYSDTEQAKAALDEFGKDPELMKRVKEAARRYRQWSDAVLRYAVDRGRMSQEAYDAITASNKFYVSFQRVSDRIAPDIMSLGTGKRLGSSRDVVKRFKGGTKPIVNPYVSLLQQTYGIMRESDRNAALASFVRLIRPASRGMYQGRPIDLDQIGSLAKEGDPDTLKVWRRGEVEHWQLHPDLYAALKNWGETEASNIVYKLLQALPRLAHSAITHSPDFIVRNAIRDPLSRAVLSETGSKPWDQFYYATPKGVGQFSDDLSHFRRAGGSLFGHYLPGREAYYREMQDQIAKATKSGGSIVTLPIRVWKGWSKFAQNSEIISRLAEFKSARNHALNRLGYSRLDADLYAAAQARGLADYSVAGTATRQINKYIIFTNAAAQSLARTIGGIQSSPRRFAARWLIYVGVWEVAEVLWNAAVGAEDEEKELSATRRDLFWNFKIGSVWLAIPKPWEMGTVASGIGRSIAAARGYERPYEGWIGSVMSSLMPVDEGAIAGPARSLVEGMANYDFFTDRNIVPPWEAPLSVENREGTADASRAGKLIQSAIGMDARQIDHFIRGQFGGLGRLALSVSDVGRKDSRQSDLLRATTGIVRKESSPMSLPDVVWVKDTARRADVSSTRPVRTLNQLLKRWRDAKEEGDTEAMREWQEEARAYARELRREWEESPPGGGRGDTEFAGEESDDPFAPLSAADVLSGAAP